MSKFIGVKMVEAVPMLAYQAMNMGYKVNTDDGDAIGYEVTYPDGYKSWCPKDVFESSYFGLEEDNNGSKILLEDVNNFITNVDVNKIGDKTTLVHAKTLTGFEMINHSSCVDPANYNELLGKEYAMEEITNKIWSHLGFVLQWAKNGLKKEEVLPPHVQRMVNEHKELEQRLTKLSGFIDFGASFGALEVEEQERLKKQRVSMDEYFHILDERLGYAFKNLNINK